MAKRSQFFNVTCRNSVGCNMLRAFGHIVATRCDILGVVSWSLKMVKFEPTTPNMSRHVATGWPNAGNILRLRMLRYWTQLIDLAPNVWLHSSVGRASHRYRGGHGFESGWSPDFFRLLLSNCLNWKIYCDDHSSLSSTTEVQIWIISYILHNVAICCVEMFRSFGRGSMWSLYNNMARSHWECYLPYVLLKEAM